MSAVSELHSAIISAWNASTLNTQFQAYWQLADRSEFSVLHDVEAAAKQPWPYCVFQIGDSSTSTRTSAGTVGASRNEIREVPWELHIFARNTTSKTAKKIASELADEVLKIFGGHVSVSAVDLVITSGSVIQTTYQNDAGMMQGTFEHRWLVQYKTQLDVPQAT